MSKSMMRAPGGTCHHDEIEPPVGGIVHEVSCAHASVVLCMYHDDKASDALSCGSLDGSMAHGIKQASEWDRMAIPSFVSFALSTCCLRDLARCPDSPPPRHPDHRRDDQGAHARRAVLRAVHVLHRVRFFPLSTS